MNKQRGIFKRTLIQTRGKRSSNYLVYSVSLLLASVYRNVCRQISWSIIGMVLESLGLSVSCFK